MLKLTIWLSGFATLAHYSAVCHKDKLIFRILPLTILCFRRPALIHLPNIMCASTVSNILHIPDISKPACTDVRKIFHLGGVSTRCLYMCSHVLRGAYVCFCVFACVYVCLRVLACAQITACSSSALVPHVPNEAKHGWHGRHMSSNLITAIMMLAKFILEYPIDFQMGRCRISQLCWFW